MQEIRRFKPSTFSRRFSVTAGFYRTCVIDGPLEHSPAEPFSESLAAHGSVGTGTRPTRGGHKWISTS
jgi:hypothetical protein